MSTAKAQVIDIRRETRLIRTAVSNANLRARIVETCTEDSFGYEATRDIFSRLLTLMQRGQRIYPRLLADDGALSDESKDILASTKPKHAPYRHREEVDTACKSLEEYRRRRAALSTARDILHGVNREVPSTKLLKMLEDGTMTARATKGLGRRRTGAEDTEAEASLDNVVRSVLSKNKAGRFQTGFTAFDTRTGGFRQKDLVTISAKRGDGKSSMLIQLLINQYLLFSRNTAVWQLELDNDQVMERILSNLTGIPHGKFYRKELTGREKLKTALVWERFREHGIKNNCVFDIYTDATNMTDLASTAYAGNYEFVGIDYLTKLKPADARWSKEERLDHDADAAKDLAKAINGVVVILTHMTDDYEVKYARAVENHSDFIWMWRMSRRDKKDGRAIIRQTKARSAEEYDFPLSANLKLHRWESLSDEVMDDDFEHSRAVKDERGDPDEDRRGRGGAGGKYKKSKTDDDEPVKTTGSRKFSANKGKAPDMAGMDL